MDDLQPNSGKKEEHICSFAVPVSKEVVLILLRYLYINELPECLPEAAALDLICVSMHLSVSVVCEHAISLLVSCSCDGFYKLLDMQSSPSLHKLVQSLLLRDGWMYMKDERFSNVSFEVLFDWVNTGEMLHAVEEIVPRWNINYNKPFSQLETLCSVLAVTQVSETSAELFQSSNARSIFVLTVLDGISVEVDGEHVFKVYKSVNNGIYVLGDVLLVACGPFLQLKLIVGDTKISVYCETEFVNAWTCRSFVQISGHPNFHLVDCTFK